VHSLVWLGSFMHAPRKAWHTGTARAARTEWMPVASGCQRSVLRWTIRVRGGALSQTYARQSLHLAAPLSDPFADEHIHERKVLPIVVFLN
jgi:hypothetical protein